MEYAFSTAIKKLSVVNKPSIAIIEGHGEPQINEIMQVYKELSILYDVQPLTLTDTTVIPMKNTERLQLSGRQIQFLLHNWQFWIIILQEEEIFL